MTEKQIGYSEFEDMGIDVPETSADRLPVGGINEELAKRDAELDMLEDERIEKHLKLMDYYTRRQEIMLEYRERLKKACEAKREDMQNNPEKYRATKN